MRRYAIEQRLRFMDFLLHQYGSVNRSAIEDYFGISPQQVSNDFAEYQAMAPDNMKYDPAMKAYIKTNHFQRVYP